MKHVFFIFGYGVPKDIHVDENYKRYLAECFNNIFDTARGEHARIVFCGGPTDCFPPYRRTEAGEMKKLFLSLAKRTFVKKETKLWSCGLLRKDLSTADNLLYSYAYQKENKLMHIPSTIFCEHTRTNRVRKMRLLVWKKQAPQVVGIDFDQSPNRYLDPEFLKQKEAKALKDESKVLLSQEALDAHRNVCKEKLAFFRERDMVNHPEVIEEWWRIQMEIENN